MSATDVESTTRSSDTLPSRAGLDAPSTYELEAGKTTEANFTMVRGGTLHARIVDDTGASAVGVAVMLKGSRDPLFAWMGRDPPPSGATDEHGNLDIIGLMPTVTYDLEASVPGIPMLKTSVGTTTVATRLRLQLSGSLAAAQQARRPGQSSDAVPAVAKAGRWIDVVVVDHDTGKPIEDATVNAMVNEAPGASHRHPTTWRTDATGRTRVGPLRPLSGKLDINMLGYTRQSMGSYGVPAPEGRSMRIRMRRELDIVGRVLTPDGQPAAGASIETNELEGSNYWGQVRADKSGRFVVRRVRGPFRYELAARWQDDVRRYQVRVDALGGSKNNVLRLEPVAGSEAIRLEERERLELVLQDEAGQPVTDVTLDIDDVDARVDENGVVRFDGPLRPDMSLEIYGARAADGHPLGLSAVHMPKLGDITGRRTVVVPIERTIVGKILDAAGNGVGRVRVRAVPARVHRTDPPASPFAHDSTTTQPDGSFRLGRLADEPYVLALTLPKEHLAPIKSVRVTPSSDPIAVRLRATCVGTLRVLDAAGEPVVGGDIVLYYEGWKHWRRHGWERENLIWTWGKTDGQGRVALRNLDPERTYDVHLEPDDSEDDLHPPRPNDRIGTWQPGATEWVVRLKPKRK